MIYGVKLVKQRVQNRYQQSSTEIVVFISAECVTCLRIAILHYGCQDADSHDISHLTLF